MKYKRSDIILCYPGIGRTFFTACKEKGVPNSTFTYNTDFKSGEGPVALSAFIESILALKETKDYRYILVPLTTETHERLSEKKVPYFIVTPYTDEKNEWVKRWLKAGASALEVFNRTCDWGTLIRVDTTKGKGIKVFLDKDEWLGNVLEQSPATAEEGNE